MNNCTARKAEFSDIEQVLEIERESINSWTYNQFAEELGRSFSVFIVAESGGVIAGYAVAWIVADEIQLNSIAVSKAFRRNGVGRQLLEKLVKNTNSGNSSLILIEVRKNNHEAVEFYKAAGFEITGCRKNYYIDDDALLMEKKIS